MISDQSFRLRACGAARPRRCQGRRTRPRGGLRPGKHSEGKESGQAPSPQLRAEEGQERPDGKSSQAEAVHELSLLLLCCHVGDVGDGQLLSNAAGYVSPSLPPSVSLQLSFPHWGYPLGPSDLAFQFEPAFVCTCLNVFYCECVFTVHMRNRE